MGMMAHRASIRMRVAEKSVAPVAPVETVVVPEGADIVGNDEQKEETPKKRVTRKRKSQ